MTLKIRTLERWMRSEGSLEERAEIEALPIGKRAEKCRDILGSHKYRYGSRGYEELMDAFFFYLDKGDVYTGEPRA
jgi:hypothetical protein